jgi:hypothetical protein
MVSIAEWLCLDWASPAPEPLPANFVHAEWITLHDNADFRGFVDFRTGTTKYGSVARLFSLAPSASNARRK